jgi:hypothetical protein
MHTKLLSFHRTLVEELCYPALPYASCCHDPQNALVEEGCAIPALPCKLAAVVITECSGGRRVCYPCAMQARCCCDPQNALVEEGWLSLPCKLAVIDRNALVQGRVCYPLPCKLAAVVIHRMLWWKRRVCYPCAATEAAVMIHRMLWWKGAIPAAMQARCCCDPQNALVQKKGVLSTLSCMQAAVMIHRMLW